MFCVDRRLIRAFLFSCVSYSALITVTQAAEDPPLDDYLFPVTSVEATVVPPIYLSVTEDYALKYVTGPKEGQSYQVRVSPWSDGIIQAVGLPTENGPLVEFVFKRKKSGEVIDLSFKIDGVAGTDVLSDEDQLLLRNMSESLGEVIKGTSYMLGQTLVPNETIPCFENDLEWIAGIFDPTGENSEDLPSFELSARCVYIGTTSFDGRRVAVFNETVQAHEESWPSDGAVSFNMAGWRMISLEAGIDVAYELMNEVVVKGYRSDRFLETLVYSPL